MAHNLPGDYQSASDQQPDVRLSDYTNSLDEIKDMLTGIEAESEFEKSMKTVVSLLIDQMKDWRLELLKKKHSDLYRHEKMVETEDEVTLSVVKSEQNTQRAVRPPLSEGPDSRTDLNAKVQAQILSLSGKGIDPLVLSAPRRNSRTKRVSFRGKHHSHPL